MNLKYKINWKLFLEAIMEQCVLTQQALACEINITQQSISIYLSGKRSPSAETSKMIIYYAGIMGINYSKYLLSNKEIKRIAQIQSFKKLKPEVRHLVDRLQALHAKKRKAIYRTLKALLIEEEKQMKERKHDRTRIRNSSSANGENLTG